jgi:hypothetical protein
MEAKKISKQRTTGRELAPAAAADTNRIRLCAADPNSAGPTPFCARSNWPNCHARRDYTRRAAGR